MFITIEGIEGVGKSTVVKFIEEYLLNKKLKFIGTREPGGTEIAEKIRSILLATNKKEPLLPKTELLLMYASRVQHIEYVIKPALETGRWVICDRFNDASFAYQGGGRKLDIEKIESLDSWLVDIKPDITFLLDAPSEIGLSRAKNRGPQDRIELEKKEFFDCVRNMYLKRADVYKERYKIINAANALEDVQLEIKNILDSLV